MAHQGTSQHENLQKAVISSAYSLVALQLVSRLFTFALNQCLLRLTSPQVFGTAAIQFELIFNTVLFLSREGVRHTVLRTPQSQGNDRADLRKTTALFNLTNLPIIFGLPSTVLATYLYGRFASEETRSQALFNQAITIYAIAAIVELVTEPLHNLAMSGLQTNIRVRAEGSGVILKPIVITLVLLYDTHIRNGDGHLALIAFALGQLAYATTLLCVYRFHYGPMSFMPKPIRSSSRRHLSNYFDLGDLQLSLTITIQSIFKQALTEGDKLILTWLSPLRDQGGYALAANYGSLIARIVFQPVEEVFRLYYSRILSCSEKVVDRRDDQVPNNALQRAALAITSLLAVQFSFSVLLFVFGPPYLPILLQLILPPRYQSTSAPLVLYAWVWYIPILAINGGLEAFFASVASPRDLRAQSRWMAVFSVIYLSSALGFYRLGLGDTSLVYANIINLAARIVYCWFFTKSYFGSRGASKFLVWKHAVPGRAVLAIAILSRSVLWYTKRKLDIPENVYDDRGHQANIITYTFLGIFLALACVSTWWRTSGRFISHRMYDRSR